ncbi:uncharacterized protein CTRU02_204830 [Colletotrichum truncatum]|uniref:Uncharacterized protein n=1 Tax=Colletotrichum truncatum TaxID=5467 RepID=A0ACC3ZDR7_COLTU|nr:uncharacterized protein CTRU02_03065 [Colletotrichum truncatum]KAF6798023.1 hypothetical protein CTRU02_03065 [Colletotrichum truncatum]
MIDMNNVFNSLPKEFPKLPKYGECSSKILVDEFCTENYKLDKDAARYYTSADAYSTAFNRYMFTLDWKKSGDQKCTNQCRQIFGDGFTTSCTCSHNSHTMAHNGTLSLDCGTASFEIFNPETASSDLTCQDSATVIPYNVFSGFDGIIYKEFCERWTPTSLMRMVVDSKGTSKIPHPQLGKRTPPAKQEDWLEYHFDLRFKPEVGAQANKECRVGCKDAFAVFPASKCGRQGSKGNSMATYAEYDVGCGKFSYQISKPTPLTLQERHCFRADEFGEHKDINPGFQSKYIMGACVGTALKENVIRKDNPSSFIHSGTVTNGAPYQYNIYWEEGCILETGAESVSPAQPLGPTHEATCANLLRDNFKKCNNGGVGGRIQAGCLVYEFKAEKRAP